MLLLLSETALRTQGGSRRFGHMRWQRLQLQDPGVLERQPREALSPAEASFMSAEASRSSQVKVEHFKDLASA